MKKLLAFVSLVLLGALINANVHTNSVQAAGGGVYGVKLTASPATAKADGASTINVTVQAVRYRCSVQLANPYGPPYNDYEERPGGCESRGLGTGTEENIAGSVGVKLVTSGSDIMLSTTDFTTNTNGYATFTVKSSVAGSKTIEAWYPGMGEAIGSISLRFDALTAVAPAPKPVTAAPVEAAAPVAPETTIEVDGAAIKADDKPTIAHNEPLFLSGKTIPNGVVTIYVFSEPKKYTATADKDGNWSHEVSGLPAGDHHIEAEVTDPATGKTSPRAQVLAFSIVKSTQPATASPTTLAHDIADTDGSRTMPKLLAMVAGGVAVLAGLIIAGLWKFKRATFDKLFHRHQIPPQLTPPNSTPPSSLS